jgi:hypothetical protein
MTLTMSYPQPIGIVDFVFVEDMLHIQVVYILHYVIHSPFYLSARIPSLQVVTSGLSIFSRGLYVVQNVKKLFEI